MGREREWGESVGRQSGEIEFENGVWMRERDRGLKELRRGEGEKGKRGKGKKIKKRKIPTYLYRSVCIFMELDLELETISTW